MEKLKEIILKEAKIDENDGIKFNSFLNQKISTDLLKDMVMIWKERFKNSKITKVVTMETAGIVFGTAAALAFGVPLVYAKKDYSNLVPEQAYSSKIYSYTKKRSYYAYIPQDYIQEGDNILIVDDVIANGWASDGLCDILNQAGASIEGIAVAIEKAFYQGAKRIRNRGIRVESLVKITKVSYQDNLIEFGE